MPKKLFTRPQRRKMKGVVYVTQVSPEGGITCNVCAVCPSSGFLRCPENGNSLLCCGTSWRDGKNRIWVKEEKQTQEKDMTKAAPNYLICDHFATSELCSGCKHSRKHLYGGTDMCKNTVVCGILPQNVEVTCVPWYKGIKSKAAPDAAKETQEKDMIDTVIPKMPNIPPPPARMTHDTITALNTKEHSPLIIRKFTCWGFPVYIGMICDSNLDNLDQQVKTFVDEHIKLWKSNKIQDKRNLAGMLNEHLCTLYHPANEGVAVVFYVDKMMVSSLFGDFMSHTSCRIEFYGLLQMMCHV